MWSSTVSSGGGISRSWNVDGARAEKKILTVQDAAHERRMLRKQIRSLGVECKYSPDQTADQLREMVIELGSEPFKPCFFREWPHKVCMLESGHKEDHYFGDHHDEEGDNKVNLQIQRMCSYADTNLVENTIPADSDCSWCDAKVGHTHSRACPNGERYKQAQQLLFLMEVDKEMTNLTDSQRAKLLQLYKSKLTQLGDDTFFDQFDSIRRECYNEMGVDLDEMERADRARAAQQLGKHGGESTSDSKSSAARENGRKGGRPKSSHKSQSIDMDEI